MHIAIITRSLPPEHCGIADHTYLLARSLRTLGHEITLIAGKGEEGDHTIIIEDNWEKEGLESLFDLLNGLSIDHLILQYIPFGFLTSKLNPYLSINQFLAFKAFWQACCKKCQASMIVHETYYRVWSYPPSWVKGSIQKHLMKALVNASHKVFSASQLLVQEMKNWGDSKKVTYLPLSSHFPVSPINREEMRHKQQISDEEIVLTLFGGGNALRSASSYINDLDYHFHQKKNPVHWLLLGGIPREWFNLSLPVLTPGRLTPDELSAWLQLTDIFLAPHSCGLAARRTTFLAALQHGLPVVGTKGYLTDAFLTDVPGLILTTKAKQFSEEVISLSVNPELRQSMGDKNKLYFKENFGWERIVNILTESIRKK